MFVEGDKVIVIVDYPHHGWGDVKPGDVGTVRGWAGASYRTGTLYVDFPRQSRWMAREEELDFADGRQRISWEV